MTDNSFLQAANVSMRYPGVHNAGVNNVDLHIRPHAITAIVGSSGSGKTTLLRLLYGLMSPDSGLITFKRERIWGPEEKLIPGHDSMKMVTQHTDDLNLFAKVADNVSILLPSTNLKAKKEKTETVLQQLNMLHLAGKRIADLSGGEKQRVAIARALVTQPEVLFLDEPFNQVDTSFRDGLQRDIRQIVKETGITVVMVSHDPAEVLSMADVLVVMKDGEIIESGAPQELYQHPGSLYTAKLLGNCNVLTTQQAKLLNISSQKQTVVIYPDDLTITSSLSHRDWTVTEILFKGFYEELLLERDGVLLRTINLKKGAHHVSEKLHIKVNRWLEY
ncbi:ABC transporter ATP-binding protein [Mucilaginibacter sp. UR6-1]|uniref:ABC transporter ATP-binding protein n=1 Tax=Mucilaginibacter sp. UR6-1 TaxID=1435643 RepID=UPI001E5DEB6F|nr:ABC transporter ATP-binding protein [Mucilaginibacter sp. UR6-1]MCC8409716.1 ABC transporter ATP-binding protein [Mucilaginibacter sp. UR6-1]